MLDMLINAVLIVTVYLICLVLKAAISHDPNKLSVKGCAKLLTLILGLATVGVFLVMVVISRL